LFYKALSHTLSELEKLMNTARKNEDQIQLDSLFSQTIKRVDSIKKEGNVVPMAGSPYVHGGFDAPVRHEQPVKSEPVSESKSYLTNTKAPVKQKPHQWVKNMVIGAGHTYYERLSMFTNPIAFILNNLGKISAGLFYVLLPAMLSFCFLYSHPQARVNLLSGGFTQLFSMIGLYIAFAFISTLALLLIRTLSLAIVRMLNNFADKGRNISSGS